MGHWGWSSKILCVHTTTHRSTSHVEFMQIEFDNVWIGPLSKVSECWCEDGKYVCVCKLGTVERKRT